MTTDLLCPVISFPKSGNTYFRHLMAALFWEGDVAAIPDIYRRGLPAMVPSAPVNGVSLTAYKSHDTRDVAATIMPDRAAQTVYLVRHPLDVCLSQLNYLFLPADAGTNGPKSAAPLPPTHDLDITGTSVDAVRAAGELERVAEAFFVFGTLQPVFRRAGGWRKNVGGWLDYRAAGGDVTVIRYEDLVTDPAAALVQAFPFIAGQDDRIAAAVALAAQQTRTDGKFFWKAKAGTHRDYFDAAFVDRFMADFAPDLCRTLGYL